VGGVDVESFNFLVVFARAAVMLSRLIRSEKTMNAELCKRANEKVGNPNVLVNIVSRRVRQLNSGGGGLSRPLILNVGNMGAADIALTEIIEEKIGWDMPDLVALVRPVAKKRKKH
jgi:DNA-directed RNA polymerase subunit omega